MCVNHANGVSRNLNKTFLHKEQDCRNKNQQPGLAHQAYGDKRVGESDKRVRESDKRVRESSECFICKGPGHRSAACPQAANFQGMIQQQQGRANLHAHQAAHDAVAYHIMMGENAATPLCPQLFLMNTPLLPATRPSGAGASIFSL